MWYYDTNNKFTMLMEKNRKLAINQSSIFHLSFDNRQGYNSGHFYETKNMFFTSD